MNDEIIDILRRCCLKFGVSEAEAKSASTKIEAVYCRKAFAIIVKSKYPVSNCTIGEYISKKHNSIHYMINNEIHDTKFNRAVSEVSSTLQ